MKKKPSRKQIARRMETMKEIPNKINRAEKLPAKKKKMNALDKAIISGKPLKSKNKNPGRYLDK